MADLGLLVIGLDGPWRRPDRVSPADRLTVRRAAGAGLAVALLTHGDEPGLLTVRLMLKYDGLTLLGATGQATDRGRPIVTATEPTVALAALARYVSRGRRVVAPTEILVIGMVPEDEPWLAAAGQAVDLRAGPPFTVAEALETFALRNNRFLQPDRPAGGGAR